MEMLDGTIVTTAAPKLGQALRVSPTAISLVVSAYLVALAVLIPFSGWLTKRLGGRVVFLSAIVVFTGASLGCAMSDGLVMLVAMRTLQGAGGAMMVPVGRMLVLSRTSKRDLLRAISYIVWPALIAPVLAPLVGALIVSHASWRWLFLINLPLGVVAFAVAWRLIESEQQAAPPLDWGGLLLTCTGLAGLTYTAHLVADTDTRAATLAACAAVSLGLLALAGWHLLRTAEPLIALRVLAAPTFRLAQLGNVLYWLVVGSTPFLLPLMFQTVFGWSPLRSGVLVLFVFVGNVAIKPATTPLINRFGFRPVLLTSALVLAASTAAFGLTSAATPPAAIAALAVVGGAARSAGLTVYNTIVFVDLPPGQIREANTLSATANQLAAGLSVAVATVVLRVGHRVGGLLPGHATGRTPYTVAFLVFALVALVAASQALRLHPRVGEAARRPPVARPKAPAVPGG